MLPSCSTRVSLLGSGAAPELLWAPESLVLGGPTSPMVSGALSQSLPEFSEELSTCLGSGVGRSGLGFRRPQGRGSQPPSRRRNMVGVCNEPPNFGAASWHCSGLRAEGLLRSQSLFGLRRTGLLGESYFKFRSGSPLPWMVIQPQVRQAACSFFSFEVKQGGTSKFTHYHRSPHTGFQESQDLTRPGSPDSVLPGFPGFIPSKQHPKFHSPRPRPKVPQKLGRRCCIQEERSPQARGAPAQGRPELLP